MKTKRPKPRKLPSGSWNCVVTVNGQRISITEESEALCQAKAIAVQEGLMQKEQKKKEVTLDAAIQRYIDERSAVLSESTVRGYEFIRKKRFPDLMKQNIHTITKSDAQIAISQEYMTGSVSAKTITNAWRFCSSVLRDNDIFIRGVKLPQKKKYEGSYIQRSQLHDFFETIKGDSCEVPILLALWLGMRRGEIMALHWDAVNFQAKTISVKRTLVFDKDNNFLTKDIAKNESSQRKIKCPDYILDKLKELKGDQTEGPCFAMHPNTILKHVHAACKRAGINDTTTHGLRHTNAATMRYVGVSDAHAMNRNGWTAESTYKNVYSYVFDEVVEEDDLALDDFFLSQTKKQNKKCKRKMQRKNKSP